LQNSPLAGDRQAGAGSDHGGPAMSPRWSGQLRPVACPPTCQRH